MGGYATSSGQSTCNALWFVYQHVLPQQVELNSTLQNALPLLRQQTGAAASCPLPEVAQASFNSAVHCHMCCNMSLHLLRGVNSM
jgi:hypothetical protein